MENECICEPLRSVTEKCYSQLNALLRSKASTAQQISGPVVKRGSYNYQTCVGAFLFICMLIGIIWVYVFLGNHQPKKQPPYKAAEKDGNHFPYVIFVQTADSLTQSALVACAVESSARTYKKKKVHFYMKVQKDESLENIHAHPALRFLKSIPNVEIRRLDPTSVLKHTPLEKWYNTINPAKETYWTHVQSDAFRMALLWHFGGMYLDTDVITIKPIPEGNFLGIQSSTTINGAVLSFRDHSPFLHACMEDFVDNYKGDVWGYQGPALLTRVLQRLCHFEEWDPMQDYKCTAQNITILKSSRFYHIPYPEWKKFYSASEDLSIFQDSYATHVWNQMNQWHEKKKIKASDNSLLVKLFKEYCPRTHAELL